MSKYTQFLPSLGTGAPNAKQMKARTITSEIFMTTDVKTSEVTSDFES